ncbi:MAG: hypothetical protein JSR48_09440 [Verrucomicrobia bacterium]|nr:hypothetical protein [Verrucomicrobiota bacterium]
MNLTWHITKKDLTRFRLPLAGYALVLIARVFLGVALRAGGGTDAASFSRVRMYLLLGVGLQALITYALVAVLMHEDATVGTQVFWRTRPISGARLLGSKLLTLALMFGVLPLLVDLGWWLSCGFGPAEIGAAARDVLLWQAALVLPALGLAVISDNAGRFFTLIVVGVGLAAFTGLMRIAYFPSPETVTWNLLQSRLWVALAITAAGLVAVIARQARARSVSPAYAILGAVAAVVPLILGGWNLDFVSPWQEKTDDSSAVTRAISLSLSAAEIQYDRETDQPNSARWLYVTLKAGDFPPDLALAPLTADLVWSARSGVLRTSDASIDYINYLGYNRQEPVRRLLGLSATRVDAETQRWQEAMAAERQRRFPKIKRTPSRPPEELRRLATLRFALRGTAKFEPPSTPTHPELTVEFALGRPCLLAELPLAATGRITRGPFSMRVADVENYKYNAPKRDGLPVEFEGRRAVLVETQPADSMLISARNLFRVGPADALSPDVWLLTRDQGEAIWGWPTNRTALISYVDGVQITWRTAVVQEPRVIRDGHWTPFRAGWDRQVTLAFVRYEPAGWFRRTVSLGEVDESR